MQSHYAFKKDDKEKQLLSNNYNILLNPKPVRPASTRGRIYAESQ